MYKKTCNHFSDTHTTTTAKPVNLDFIQINLKYFTDFLKIIIAS